MITVTISLSGSVQQPLGGFTAQFEENARQEVAAERLTELMRVMRGHIDLLRERGNLV